MNWLPQIDRGTIAFRLPLGEPAALGLAEVLLADSDRERSVRLEAALADDAALAIWAALLAPEPTSPDAALEETALWLAPRLARIVAGASPISIEAPCAPARSADGLTTAAPRRADIPERNGRFLRLLATAPEWLVDHGNPRPDRAAAIALLPNWLARIVEQFGSDASGEPPLNREQVVSGSGPWQDLLPRLAGQAARLGDLEADLARAVEQEKLAALKEFAYGAGHEINNPLANISARAQTLLKDERDPERRQKLAAINTQAFRAHEMIADLMLFAQPPQWQATRVPLAPLVDELASSWQRQAAEQATTLAVKIVDERLAAWADRGALAVALKALVANALEAVGRGGTIEISVMPARIAIDAAALQSHAAPSHDAVAIAIRDDGPGIDPKVRARIFDPFFSGREAGRGLGFGLPKCWRIATALGGRIDVGGGPGGGATFTLALPASQPSE